MNQEIETEVVEPEDSVVQPTSEEMDSQASEEDEPDEQDSMEASAMNIPRPRTALSSPPDGEVGGLEVSLLHETITGPALREVERMNQGDVDGPRTPLMTVIEAVLMEKGATMTVKELTEEVVRYWNRPFPTSPYTPEEFVYVVIRDSDHVKVRS